MQNQSFRNRALHRATLLAAALLFTLPLASAQMSYRDASPYVPRYTVGVSYSTTRGNAPPGGLCQCFSTNGIAVNSTVTWKYWLRSTTEVNNSRASNIGPLGQNLTLTTITAGPQIVLHGRYFETFAGLGLGFAHGSNSYFPTSTGYSTSANSFAWKTGGGFDVNLNHRLAVRAVEVQYLHTAFPNGMNDSQNHITVSVGLLLKMRGHLMSPTY
jgi:opacity protein-like surface antigen